MRRILGICWWIMWRERMAGEGGYGERWRWRWNQGFPGVTRHGHEENSLENRLENSAGFQVASRGDTWE